MKQLLASVLALSVLGATSTAGLASEPQAKEPPAKAAPKEKEGAFPDLVAAIKATPGCLGVDTAQTASGKSVIFAWFEDKKAVMKWYHSDVHQEVMKLMAGKYEKPDRRPLADVPDDSGPLMLVASITLAGKPTKDNPLPFKQISIEIYKPLSGGLSIGGSFAPEKMKVPVAKPEKK